MTRHTDSPTSSAGASLTLEQLYAAVREVGPCAGLIVSGFVDPGQLFRFQLGASELEMLRRSPFDTGIRWTVNAADAATLEASTGVAGEWIADGLERAYQAGRLDHLATTRPIAELARTLEEGRRRAEV